MGLRKWLEQWGFTIPSALTLLFTVLSWASTQGYTMFGVVGTVAYGWDAVNSALSAVLPLVVGVLLSLLLWMRKRKREDRIFAEWLNILGGNIKAAKQSLAARLDKVEEAQEALEKRIDNTEWDWNDFKNSSSAVNIAKEMQARRLRREVLRL